MTRKPLYLVDQSAVNVATLDVQFRDDHYEGTISLDATQPQLRQLFDQFEKLVEGQMFSLLDDIEQKIGTMPLRVRFDDGEEADVADLQVFPITNAVSFKTRRLAFEPDDDDDLIDRLLESNPAFRALVEKSKASTRRPFPAQPDT
jgi:hypothetical protein